MARGLWVVLLGWGALAIFLYPFSPVPFVDDWVYAWSVERLLTDGRLEVLDFSSNAIFAQALWGALFSLPFGFSFEALRLSTWVLSCLAVAGTYRLLKETGATETAATLGTAAVAAFPPFLVLSFSFMTDVPLVAVQTWALVFFARAWRNGSERDLWIGTGLTCCAAAIRTVGLVPALAMAAALLVHGPRRWRSLVPLAAVPVAAAIVWYHAGHVLHVADLQYVKNTAAPRLEALREHGLTLLPAWLPLSLEFLAVGTGLALTPVAFGLLGHVRWRHAMWVAAGAAAVVVVGHLTGELHYPAFASEGTWVSDELGAVVTLLPGWRPIKVPTAAILAATLVCWANFVILAAAVIHREHRIPAAPVFAWLIAGLVMMTAVLWLATDRYILPFLSPVLALVLGRGTVVTAWRGILAIAMFAAIGGVALHDRTNAERALWSAIDDLRARGVPVSQIDAGYTANGWLQYAHPGQAHHDASGHVAVPFVNADATLTWVVSAMPLRGVEPVREYSFQQFGRVPGSIFVSTQVPASTPAR